MGAAVVIAVVVVLVALGAVFGIVVPWLKAQPVYRVVPLLPAVEVTGVANEALLASAITHAVDELAAFGVWRRYEIEATVLRGVRVCVRSEVRWNDGGQVVAGLMLKESRTLVVGCDLAALCHELAHLVQWDIERREEFGHETWTVRGITSAVDAWQAWLKGAQT